MPSVKLSPYFLHPISNRVNSSFDPPLREPGLPGRGRDGGIGSGRAVDGVVGRKGGGAVGYAEAGEYGVVGWKA